MKEKVAFIVLFALLFGVAIPSVQPIISQSLHPCGESGTSQVVLKNSGQPNESFGIISQPLPKYPQDALFKHLEGIVSLRVTFLANGKIGKIIVVRTLAQGLTEAAIKAARQIKFMPEKKNGKSITVAKIIEYRFRGLRKCL